MKKIIFYIILAITVLDVALAGCGGCAPTKTQAYSHYTEKNKRLIESVPKNMKVDGNVLISCGMCNFFTEDKTCAVSVKIGRDVFKVHGVDINDHGDSHAVNGYCNVIKRAYVNGKLKDKKLYAEKIEFPKI
tara:strand:+ start:47687 stop:48082 length:396 start_codon:yes stop_codon:yes gene_type:complete